MFRNLYGLLMLFALGIAAIIWVGAGAPL